MDISVNELPLAVIGACYHHLIAKISTPLSMLLAGYLNDNDVIRIYVPSPVIVH